MTSNRIIMPRPSPFTTHLKFFKGAQVRISVVQPNLKVVEGHNDVMMTSQRGSMQQTGAHASPMVTLTT